MYSFTTVTTLILFNIQSS